MTRYPAVRVLAIAGAVVFAAAAALRAAVPHFYIVFDRATMSLSLAVAGVAFALLAGATAAHLRGAAAARLAAGAFLTLLLGLFSLGTLGFPLVGWDALAALIVGIVAVAPVSAVYAVLAWRERAVGDLGAAALAAGALGLALSAFAWGATQLVFDLAFSLGWAAFGWSARRPRPHPSRGT